MSCAVVTRHVVSNTINYNYSYLSQYCSFIVWPSQFIRMRGSSFLFLAFLLQVALSTKFLVDPEKNRIIDDYGRERIFHGENVVMKTTPFVPITTHFDARYVSLPLALS